MKALNDILDSEEKIDLLVKVFSAFDKKCNQYINRPTQGFGSSSEEMKKRAWQEDKDAAYLLLSEILEELN
jgi:hypothetical protein